MFKNKFYLHQDDQGHSGHVDDNLELDHDLDEDMVIQIVDPDTEETFDFYLGDEFEYEDNLYYVLVPVDEVEEPVYAIARIVEEDGEAYIETLTAEESDEIYQAYEKILEEYFSSDDLEDDIED